MSGILFLAHRLPFPPDRGDKIRSHHILKALAKLAPVHVGCFAESRTDFDHEPELARIAASHCLAPRSKPTVLAGVEALARGEPVSVSAFRSTRLQSWVDRTLASGAVDTVYLFSGQMGQFLPRDWKGRVVADLVDVDSAKFEAYAAQGRGPARWMNRREGWLLAGFEAALAARADHTLLVSDAEVRLFQSRAPGVGDVRALRNGIDASAYDPTCVTPLPELAAQAGPHLVFTGQMDYAPNVAAALRTIERLLPAIRLQHPDATFHVVGRSPTPRLRAFDGIAGVRVWGAVPDVRPFLAAADLVVAPLEIARGVQNKVLEAMAMARPVLLTPEAATGIDAADGKHFAVAKNDGELVARAIQLLGDPASARAIGAAARQLVTETMSWPAALSDLPAIVGRDAAREERHAA